MYWHFNIFINFDLLIIWHFVNYFLLLEVVLNTNPAYFLLCTKVLNQNRLWITFFFSIFKSVLSFSYAFFVIRLFFSLPKIWIRCGTLSRSTCSLRYFQLLFKLYLLRLLFVNTKYSLVVVAMILCAVMYFLSTESQDQSIYIVFLCPFPIVQYIGDTVRSTFSCRYFQW